jgi:hypothetical protein
MGTTATKWGAGSRGRGRKGISTVVAISIFFMLFALALTTVYTWQMMLAEYSEVGIQQLSLDNLRVSERLDVDIINSYALLLTNPTSQSIRVVHVLSDNKLVFNGSFDVAPFSSATLYHLVEGGERYRVVTMRGNVFSAGMEDRRGDIAELGWQVTFRMNETVPVTHYDWGNSTAIGETYWYNTDINWVWNNSWKAYGNLSIPGGTCVGFVATAKFVKVVNESYNATFNYYIDTGDSTFDKSKVAVVIDGVLMRPLVMFIGDPTFYGWYDSSHYVWFTLSGPEYSTHEVSVYFYGKDVEVQRLSLNVVNATLAP